MELKLINFLQQIHLQGFIKSGITMGQLTHTHRKLWVNSEGGWVAKILAIYITVQYFDRLRTHAL